MRVARKLKIAVWYNLPSGGGKRVLHYHIRGLQQRGHRLEAWRPPVFDEKFAAIGELIPEHVVPFDILGEGGNYVQKIYRHVQRPRLMMDSMRAHSIECAKQIDAGDWDVLFSNTCMYFSSPYIARYSALPTALYIGEPHRPFYEAFPTLPWPALPEEVRKSWSLRSIKTRLRDRYDTANARIQAREELVNAKAHTSILVNSYYSRESILRAYGLNSTVCYLGIDQQLFADQQKPREPFVVGLGTIGPSKNVRFAIESVGAIKGAKPPLVWIGNMSDDVYVPEMQALAESLGVDFQPRKMVSDAELVDTLNRATVMVYAPRLEPFGLAPLEANACGCPVIAVAEGGVKETIVDGVNGRLVQQDACEMGSAIADMVANPSQAARMGQEAKRLVGERWRLEGAIDRIEDALLKVAR